MGRKSYLYYAHTMPGLERVAWEEVRARLDGASLEGLKTLGDRNGLVLFRYGGEPSDLLRLRTAEDVFFLVGWIPKVEWGYEGLSQIYHAMLSSRFLGLGVATQAGLARTARRGRRSFRVVSRMVGRNHPYRRIDLQRAVERALKRRSQGKWRLVQAGEDLEIWANLIGLDFICGLRLSDASMRHRDYKVAHVAASLRPSVAAAMVWLTDPGPADVFLDPMCGAGTLLVERGMMERHALLLGSDIEEGALRVAALNIGRKHKPRQLLRSDARRLPLAPHSVDRLATNLPFGRKIGSQHSNVGLYRAFLGEVDRVLSGDGRAVVLTSEARALKEALRGVDGLRPVKSYPMTLLGRRASIYVIARPRPGRRGGDSEAQR